MAVGYVPTDYVPPRSGSQMVEPSTVELVALAKHLLLSLEQTRKDVEALRKRIEQIQAVLSKTSTIVL